MIRSVFVVAFCTSIFLFGCASKPNNQGYIPLVGDDKTGYFETPLRANVFEVSYSSPGIFNPTKARFFATVRAAEVTVAVGAVYFEVLQARPGENTALWADAAKKSSLDSGVRTNGDVTFPGISSLVIQVLPAPSPASLNALLVLREAERRGLTLSQTSADALHNASLPPDSKRTLEQYSL